MTPSGRPPSRHRPLEAARRLARRLVLGALALAVLGGGPVQAQEQTRVTAVSEREAREAVAEFSRAVRARDVAARVAAVERLAGVQHPRATARLASELARPGDPLVEAAIFRGLATHRDAGEKIMKKVMAWIEDAAREESQRLKRGTPDVRIDPRTGEPDTTSEEGRLVLAATRARGAVLKEAIHCLRLLAQEAPPEAERLAVFLQDASDDLVTETLAAFGAWKTEAALPAVLDLYRMYPTEASWQTGAVVDLGGTDASAKAAWMVLFGHPDKRRARPAVVQALEACVLRITGERLDGPDALQAWLEAHRPQGKARRRSAA